MNDTSNYESIIKKLKNERDKMLNERDKMLNDCLATQRLVAITYIRTVINMLETDVIMTLKNIWSKHIQQIEKYHLNSIISQMPNAITKKDLEKRASELGFSRRVRNRLYKFCSDRFDYDVKFRPTIEFVESQLESLDIPDIGDGLSKYNKVCRFCIDTYRCVQENIAKQSIE